MEKNEERMAAEVLQVLDLLNKEDYKKIPPELISYLNEKCNYRVATIIDPTKKLKVQDVCPETLDMIGQIYKTFLAKPEEKEKIQSANGFSRDSTDLFNKLAKESSTTEPKSIEDDRIIE